MRRNFFDFFFTLLLIAQCGTFLEAIFILSLRGQSGLVRSGRMRLSLDYSDHIPLAPSSKSLEISLIQEIYKCILTGLRDLVAYCLFPSPLTLNGDVTNTYIRNTDFK